MFCERLKQKLKKQKKTSLFVSDKKLLFEISSCVEILRKTEFQLVTK